MASVSEFVRPVKPSKAFRSILYEEPGVLTKVGGRLLFFSDEGSITELECDQCNFIVVLGEIGIAETQALMDTMHGGAARRACSRTQETQ